MSKGEVIGNIYVNFKTNTASVTSGTNLMRRQTREAMLEVRKEVTESNHSLAIMGETIGVGIPRHIRTFVSELPGVSVAMSAAFDAFAVVLLIKVLVEVGEKVAKLHEKWVALNEQPNRMIEGMQKVLRPIEATNDALEVTKDKLEQSIAKLQGKPFNGVKLAIDEAIEAAGKLHAELEKSSELIAKTLKEKTLSTVGQWLINKAGNADVTQGFQGFSKRLDDATAEHKSKLENLNKNDEEGKEAENRRHRTAVAVINATYEQDLNALLVISREQQALFQKAMTSQYVVRNPDGSLPEDQSIRQSSIGTANQGRKELVRSQLSMMDVDDYRYENAKLEGKKGDQSKANEKIRKDLEARYDLMVAANGKSLGMDEFFWSQILMHANHGSEQMKVAVEKLQKTWAGYGQENSALHREFDKLNAPNSEVRRAFAPGLSEEDAKGLEEKTKNTLEWIKAMGEGVNLQRAASDAMQEANLRYQEAVGGISKTGAAMEMARIKTKAYADEIRALQERLAGIQGATYLTAGEKRAQGQQTQNQIVQLTGQMNLEQLRGRGDADSRTAQAGVHQFFQAAIEESQDAATKVRSILKQAQDGLNAELVKGMTGQKMDFGKMFQGLASSTLTAGLEKMEGGLFDKLGFGKMGTHSNPMIVQDANGGAFGAATGDGGDSSGGTGKLGFLKHLFSFIPGFASGGDPTGLALVGENGPELANFGGGGHVTNNRDTMALLGGGGTHLHIGTIDARGTNAADVEMRMHRVAQMYSKHGAQTSMRAQQERAARRPRSS